MIENYRIKTTLLCVLLFTLFSTHSNGKDISELSFKNVTSKVLVGETCEAGKPFDVDFIDANNDGLFDLFAFSHGGVSHCLYLQNKDGTFNYIDGHTSNYTQSKIPPRGSSRATFADLNGDKKEDFTGLEADITSAVWLNITESGAHIPKYKNKSKWCESHDHCTIGELNGDGVIDVIHNDGRINAASGRPVKNIKKAGNWNAVDINNDSWPDLIDPSKGGYWKNHNNSYTWVPTPELLLCEGGRIQDYADYNNDGFIDVLCSNGNAKTKNNGGSWFIFKNVNGNSFKNMTSGSGIDKLGWLPYWTSYSNTYNADLNNDTLIDITFAGLHYTKGKGLVVMQNKGDFIFEKVNLNFNDHCQGNYKCKPRVDIADYNNDGQLDLLKMYAGSDKTSIELYENTSTNNNNWIKIRVRGKNKNTDGLHTKLNFYDANSNELLSSYQILSHFDGRMRYIHTGLGSAEKVNVEITWPHEDGVEMLNSVKPNQELILYYSKNGTEVIKNWTPGNGW